MSVDSAASLCPVPGAATSDLAQRNTGARASQPLVKTVGTREVTVNHGVQQQQPLEKLTYLFLITSNCTASESFLGRKFDALSNIIVQTLLKA